MSDAGVRHADALVAYLRAESVADVPVDVETDLRRRIVDAIAAVIAGHQVDGIDVTTAYVADTYEAGPCTVLDGSGRRLAPAAAALANGLAANALDIDDGSRKAEGHPAAVIVPAALGAAERADASVGALVDAVLASYEIAVRTAPALKSWTGLWNGSGSWGAVGAAAAAARLWDLDAGAARHALGIAEFNAPIAPNQRSVATPGSSMTKDGIGWGSHVGTTAARLAEEGLRGSGTVFDEAGPVGDDLATLGDRYYLTAGYYKPYPGCRWAHPGLDAAYTLLDEHDFHADDIQQVRVHTFEKALDLETRDPANPDQAQYSYPYLLAAALAKGEWLAPVDLNAERRRDPAVRDLVDRITLHHDEDAQARYTDAFTARVEIETTGATYASDLTHPRGAPERPMTPADHERKQSLLIDEHLGDGTAARLRQLLGEDDRAVRDMLESVGIR